MDPFLEQKLRDEVIHLHSLWHQGPPSISNPNPYPINPPKIPIFNPNPYPNNPIVPNFNPNPYTKNPIIPKINPNPCINNPIIPNFNPDPYTNNPIILNVNPNPCINNLIIPNFNPHPHINIPVVPNLIPSQPANFKKAKKKLKPSNSTQFKKEKKRRRAKRGGNKRGSDRLPVSDIEWPCNPDPPETSYGWPQLNLKPAPAKRTPTAEEQVHMLATQLQQKALKAAQELFANNMESDDEVENDDDDDIMDDDDGCEEYRFFLKIFMEDSELRGYYEKNYASGEFCCLVCGGIGQKVGKRFKDCVALAQHSITIAKTKKRQAHRAFGQAICKVLGWDIDKLPAINLPKLGDSQGNGPVDGKGISNVCDSVNVDNGEAVLNKNDSASEALNDKAVSLSNAMGGKLIVCQHSLMVADGNKSLNDLEKDTPSMAQGNEERVVNCLCRNLTKRMVLEAPEME